MDPIEGLRLGLACMIIAHATRGGGAGAGGRRAGDTLISQKSDRSKFKVQRFNEVQRTCAACAGNWPSPDTP